MNLITLRLSEDEIREIDKLAKEQKIDRASLLRQIIATGLKRRKLKLAREYYENGDSLGSSAEKVNLSIWDIVGYFEEFWIKIVKEKLSDQ